MLCSTDISVLFFSLIACVIALLIALVKKINEKYPLNVALVIIYVRISDNLFTFTLLVCLI